MSDPTTIVTDNIISTVKNILAVPRTWENEKNGNILLSMGSQEMGCARRLLIHIHCITVKKGG